MTELTTDPAPTAAPPTLQSLHHIGLTVTDVARSEGWYATVFGFERLMVEPHHGGTGYAVVLHRPGSGVFLGLDHHTGNDGATFAEHRTGLDHVAIAVGERAELDQWARHLDALGVAHSGINDRAEPFPFATLIVRDPDNIQLELLWMPS